MKLQRFVVWIALLIVSVAAVAQSTAQKANLEPAKTAVATPSESQKAFSLIKSLAGNWSGPLTTTPPEPSVQGHNAQFSLKVASRGNTLLHELTVAGLPDHPVTLFYVDNDQLFLTHYCDAGNRPRMQAKVSPDGKKIEFEFVDVAGPMSRGHMHHAVFTFIDENHHTEDWTYMLSPDKSVVAHFDLQRAN